MEEGGRDRVALLTTWAHRQKRITPGNLSPSSGFADPRRREHPLNYHRRRTSPESTRDDSASLLSTSRRCGVTAPLIPLGRGPIDDALDSLNANY